MDIALCPEAQIRRPRDHRLHGSVTGVTAWPAARMDYLWQHRSGALPIQLMAVLALVVFGAMGMLLTMAVILERWVCVRAAKRNRAHPMTTAGTSGAGNSRDPKFDEPHCGGAESAREGEISWPSSSIRKPILQGRESAITKNWNKSCRAITVPC